MNPKLYTQVIEADLSGDEDEVRRTLAILNESELSRLRNCLHNIATLAEIQRKRLRRVRGLS